MESELELAEAIGPASPAPEGVRRPGLSVVELNDRAAFAALEHEWNDLVRDVDDQIFYRHEFIRVWLDNFAPDAVLRILVARDETERLCAVLPLVERKTSLYGIPAKELSAAANAHSCRFDLIARDPGAAAQLFLDHLRRTPGWDVIRLTDVPQGGAAWHLFERAKRAGLPVGAWPSLNSPYVPLPHSAEELKGRLDAKFRANLRRRRRRLEERGRVSVEWIGRGPELEARLDEGFCLEESGWKGDGGTAISQSRATRGFYSELARVASYQKQLAAVFLRLDGCAVAFHFALEYGGRYLLLKPAYDESLKECSPGQLLMEEVLAACVARGFSEFDFLGPDMPWKRDWAEQARPHAWLYLFRDSPLGRLLQATKFQWLPAMKQVASRWTR